MLKLSTCPIIGICARGTDHATQRHKNCPPIRLLTNYALLPTHTESTPQATPISFLWDTGIEKKAEHVARLSSFTNEDWPLPVRERTIVTIHCGHPRQQAGACPGFVTDVAEKPRIQNVGRGILAESPTKFTSRSGRI